MNNPPVKIGDRYVGGCNSVALVGEIGINANGDKSLALEMMKMVEDADWNYVKFQKRYIQKAGVLHDDRSRGCYKDDFLSSPRESPWGSTQRDQKEALEFSKEDYEHFDKHSKAVGVPWYASPWDIPSVEFLSQFDPPAYKIASPLLTNRDLLLEIRKQDKPVIVSTGMSTISLVDDVVKLMDWHIPVILLHCVSIYPCPPHYLQLSGIQFLQNRYEQCPVGYSGHEEGILPSVIAWMMGACMIERHITTDRNMYGSDQKAAITMNEMRLLRQLTSGERIDIGEMKGRFNRKTLIGTEEAVMEKFISQMRGIFMP